MSENKRSFFATIPGLVTGLAGLLTGVVGLVTVLIQLDVIGGDDTNGSVSVGAGPTTIAPSRGGAATTTPTTEQGTFTVTPNPLNFGPADPKEKVLTVRNTGRTKLTFLTPRVVGKDAARFTVPLGDCGAPLEANLSCTLRVTFAPSGPLATYEAAVQVQAPGAKEATEVKLTGSTLLS